MTKIYNYFSLKNTEVPFQQTNYKKKIPKREKHKTKLPNKEIIAIDTSIFTTYNTYTLLTQAHIILFKF